MQSQYTMTTFLTSGKKRGRPRDPARLGHIIQAASLQFLTAGFERTSMDAVAKLANISKVTLYNYFSSKQALFEACVQVRTDAVLDMLSPIDLNPLEPRRALENIAKQFLLILRDEQILRMYRMLMSLANASTPASAAMCDIYYTQGPKRLVAQVADFLAVATKSQSLKVPDPMVAADQFCSLFHNLAYLQSLAGLKTPTPAEDAVLVVRNIDFFMLHYGLSGAKL